ncbi:MAG: glutamyl-tRNA reductase [Saprospiraceae bacterium]|nr:glutamyl-tRNA reductase [Saprospiraceae bacterium]
MENIHNYKIITITHKQIQLKKIGRYVLPNVDTPEAMGDHLHALKEQLGLSELMYLSTCNRVTFLFTCSAPITAFFKDRFFDTVYDYLTEEEKVEGKDSAGFYEGREAIQHLLEVASSTDSLVVGEREILRQLRTSYEQCRTLGTTGDSIRLILDTAIEVAKYVYSNTKIGEKPISVVSLAIQRMLMHGIPNDAHFLIVGAGQTNNLVAKFLIKHQFSNFTVFNRTLSRAQDLAHRLDAKAHQLEDLADYKGKVDVIIACTGATEHIITPELYHHLVGEDRSKKVLLDLAVPNNIDPKIAELNDNVRYIEIEHLQFLAKQNMSFRKKEMLKAKKIIAYELNSFIKKFEERQLEKALHEIPQQIKAIKGHAVGNVFKKELNGLDQNTLELVTRMMDYMEKRCISIPMEVAKTQLVHKGSKRQAMSKRAKQRILRQLITDNNNEAV